MLSHLILLALALTACASGQLHPSRRGSSDNHWVNIWTEAPEVYQTPYLPSGYSSATGGYFNDTTLRQTFRMTLAASTLRLRVSNAFSDFPLSITSLSVAHPQANATGSTVGVSEIVEGSAQALTFSGNTSIEVAPEAVVLTDAFNFAVSAGDILSVSIYLAQGQGGFNATGHTNSQTISWLTMGGDQTTATNFTDPSTASGQLWLFVEGVEAWLDSASRGVVCLGDSITDGYLSTINGNDRWADDLSRRLQNDSATSNIAVLNKGISSGTVLTNRGGRAIEARVNSDVLTQPGTAYTIVLAGVNDIGAADNTTEAQDALYYGLIAGYEQIVRKIHTFGIPVFGGTITPFGYPAGVVVPGSTYDPTREVTRVRLNEWILNSGVFDATIDFASALANKTRPSQMITAYATSGWLHPNPIGYQAMANAINLTLFEQFSGGVSSFM